MNISSDHIPSHNAPAPEPEVEAVDQAILDSAGDDVSPVVPAGSRLPCEGIEDEGTDVGGRACGRINGYSLEARDPVSSNGYPAHRNGHHAGGEKSDTNHFFTGEDRSSPPSELKMHFEQNAAPAVDSVGPDAASDSAISAAADDLEDGEFEESDLDQSQCSASPAAAAPKAELRGWPKFEAWVERLAHKYAFIRKITSRLYLPIAFHSGLTMKKLDPQTFTYVLPFRRFNRNFYDAMAGAALVANSEIAAGMYLFGELGGQWTIVCKNIAYRFLRPCLGPAIYRVNALDDVKARMMEGVEFNIDLTLEILQQALGKKQHPRVGRCEVTFHCAPKGPEGNSTLRKRRRRRLKNARAVAAGRG